MESDIDVFAGDTELAGRMRAFDWSATSLGPAASWPQSLKTCVRIVLTSSQPMFVWWGDALINLYNDAYKAILGGKHPDALGQPAQVVWREIWEHVLPRAQQAMHWNVGTYDEALLLIMERNGYPEETYYTFSYSPVPDDNGRVGGLICANTDDTQRILAERQMATLRELAARASDARTADDACALSAQALETNPRDLPFALVYLVDADGRGARLAGAAGLDGWHAAAPPRIAFDDSSPWPLAEVLKTQTVAVVSDATDRFGALPTGAWDRPPSRVALVPIASQGRTEAAGVLVAALNPYRMFDDGYRGFLTLVAGQIAASLANAQAYEEERRRAEALAEIDRAKTMFFSNVSHEFRTPLTLMIGPTEDALARGGGLSGSDLATVHRNEVRLLKLVNALLDFSRIEAGRAQAQCEAIDLAMLTADLASAFRSAIERGGLRFEVDCPPLPAPVAVDPRMWEKIVLNLLSNAFKFTFDGDIVLRLRQTDDRLELTVRDTGVGIPADELPRIFERFHRVEQTRGRTYEGTGIGLALVQELAKLHGGAAAVASEVGVGTTFTVTIPVVHAATVSVGTFDARASAQRAGAFVEEARRWVSEPFARHAPDVSPRSDDALAPTAAAESASRTARVLLADDNGDMRDYLRRLLSVRWDVEAVVNGADALRAARRAPPDLMLADVMMPELDGFGLLRELRADPDLRSIPVMLLSARAGEEARVEGLNAGADDYVVKPFSARELVARVEAQLLRAEIRAVEARQTKRMADVFRQAPAAIAILRGPDHVFEIANQAYLDLVAGRDVVGKPVREALPDIGAEVYGLLDQVFRTGEPYVGSALRLMVQRQADHPPQERFFDFVYQPLFDEQRRVTGIGAVVFEVSELVRARRQAEAASRAKDDFLAILGHELRNPLAPIMTAVQMMRLRGADEVEKERAVIERQARHLIRLVDDLLDVSRVARGRIELQRERLELAAIVTSALESVSGLLEQNGHDLAVHVAPRGLPIDGDAARLTQVVANLLTNAAKYTPPGGCITVAGTCLGDEIEFTVRDTGIGIAPEMLSTIFDLFVQDRQALDRSRGGLGLGLAIVRSIVELHGGRVRAWSEGLGRGAAFTVTLPVAGQLRVPPRDGSESAQAPVMSPTWNGRRVLVVDDNADAAVLLAESLEHLGYRTLVANDGQTALAQAADFLPHVALLDIGLPGMNGYQLAPRLRAAVPGGLAIVAVTGYGAERDRQEAQSAGFDTHLVKPVSLDVLRNVLDGLPNHSN